MATDLWQTCNKVAEQALSSGALLPIETELEEIQEGSLRFQIRVLSNLQHKQNNQRLQSAASNSSNPFLPYEPDLYVADIGNKHRCLLNKFNVIENHLLIVTKEFEQQSDLLNLYDFHAAVLGLKQIDGLVFFNGGKKAGASQPHKHLQLIPVAAEHLPLAEQICQFTANTGSNSHLPFSNTGTLLPDNLFGSAVQAAGWLYIQYLKLLDQFYIRHNDTEFSGAYNLLLTRNWLMLIPRSQEKIENISFNALAFCGSILVKNKAQRDRLVAFGISNSLQQIT